MTDQEIIVKAEAALKAVELNFDDETIASVSRNHDKLVLEEMPELDNEYFVHFSKKGIDGRKTGFTVTVEKKTDKLLTIITKSNIYEVPKEFQ